MNAKKAIAITGLTILAITLGVLGATFGWYKPKTMVETQATFISNVNTQISNTKTYTIEGGNTCQYIDANSDTQYKFLYRYDLNVSNSNTTLRVYGTININSFTYNNTTETIDINHTIDESITTGTNQNPIFLVSIAINQYHFQIVNDYNLTINTSFAIRHQKMGQGPLTRYVNFETTKTLNNPYPTIENTENNIFDQFDVKNNLQTIITYGQEQNDEGYQEGYYDGQGSESVQEAYNEGHTTGYQEGYNDSQAFNHPIELHNLMLQILSMPFSFLSKAFDVTLWPNTPYEFNIANFIKGLIAIAAIIFIIKIFTSGFSIMGNFSSKMSNKLGYRKPMTSKPNKDTKKKE